MANPSQEPQENALYALRDKTKAFSEIPNGSRPLVYEQVIPEPKKDVNYGQPDPVHYWGD